MNRMVSLQSGMKRLDNAISLPTSLPQSIRPSSDTTVSSKQRTEVSREISNLRIVRLEEVADKFQSAHTFQRIKPQLKRLALKARWHRADLARSGKEDIHSRIRFLLWRTDRFFFVCRGVAS